MAATKSNRHGCRVIIARPDSSRKRACLENRSIQPPSSSWNCGPSIENLSNDREDASFTDGVQDDLLTKLAKIADLKVISRTSVMGYRGKQNTRQIGDELGVSHLLEGSVRKTGAWLHINAQLIDVHTNAHIWAEEYDRDVKEMFSVQSEIARTGSKAPARQNLGCGKMGH